MRNFGYFILLTLIAATSPMRGNEYCCDFYEEPCCFYTHSFTDQNCWVTGIEYLYWTVLENQLDFAVNGGPIVLTQAFQGAVGTMESAKYNWRSGVRGYLDYILPCEALRIRGDFTYFYTNGSSSVTPAPNEILAGTFDQLLDDPLTEATSNIHFNYYIADLTCAYRICLTPNLLAGLQMGGIGGVINQRWRVNYFSTPILTGRENLYEIDWQFSGGGLTAGGFFDWDTRCGLGLHGEVSGGILFGLYKNRIQGTSFLPDGSGLLTITNFHNLDHRLVETLHLAIGPNWNWHCCCTNVSVFALYEMNAWFNLHEVYRTTPEPVAIAGKRSQTAHGFVGLHGLTLGIEVAF